MMKISTLSTIAVLALFPLVASAGTTTAMISGSGNLGDFSGNLKYSSTTADLIISLTNEKSTDAGGVITAFALNNPDGDIKGIDFSRTYTDFNLLGPSDDGVNGQPYGDFDFGASTGVSFLGGDTHGAIANGDTATFTFHLTGDDVANLTVEDFLQALSDPRGNHDGQPFLVRFQGFDGGGSDEVPIDHISVPEPAGLLIFGVGLLGLAGFSYTRQKRAGNHHH